MGGKWTVLLVLLSLIPGCNEQLPPYADPRNILSAETHGEYVLTVRDNSVNFFVVVRNDFDESLQAVAAISGTMEIVLQRDTTVRKTVTLSNTNLIHGTNYVPSTGEIIFDAGDTVTLLYKWDWIDDQGRDLRLETFRYHEDLQCDCGFYNRALADEEVFTLRGEVKMFDRVGRMSFGPTAFHLRFASRWVNPKYCPPVLPDLVPAYGPKPCTPLTFAPYTG